MIPVWKTRFLLWKKHAIILFIWLCFPIVGTVIIIFTTENIQDDSKIPVGIVIEENTKLAKDLYEQISKSTLLRIVDVTNVEARQMVRSQKIDSAFVITEGLEDAIKNGNRNWIVHSYSTDLSLGYIPAKELIISYIQEASGKAKAAHTVQKLSEGSGKNWNWDDIVMKTNDIQLRENLLHTDFTFYTETQNTVDEASIWNIWGIWATLSLLATPFLFDWVTKERKSSLTLRLPFMRISMRNYLLFNLILYGILLFVFDLLTAYIFHLSFYETVTITLIYHLLMFRTVLILGAFFIALLFTNTYFYYCISILISLVVVISSGAIIPTEETVFTKLHPFYPFLEQDGMNLWIFPLLLSVIFWWIKGGKMKRAKRTVLK